MAHSKCPYLSGTMSTSSSSSSIQDCHLLHEDACGTTSGTTISISSDGDDSSMMMSPSSSTSSLQEEACVQQAWQLKRPVLQHDVKLTRRQLRCLNRTWTLDDVAQHRFVDDGWIAVDGKVYDITEHVVSHPGWDTGCSVSTVLSIIAHLGTECSQEFREIHAPYPVAWNQLRAFYIGNLEQQPTAAASGVDE